MSNSLRHQNILIGMRALLTLSMACCLTSISFGVVEGMYKLNIGESPRYLDAVLQYERGLITADELYVIKYEESCMNPSIRLHDKNRPVLMIENTSIQDNFLSSFVLDIQEAGFEFGTGDIANDNFLGKLILNTSYTDPGVTVTANYVAGDRTKLQVNFTGLGRDKAALFRIDLDPVPMVNVAFPDYRGILMGANVGQGATDPALISSTFTMTGMPSVTTTPVPFDGSIPGTIQSGLLEVYLDQDKTSRFEIIIPEPATLSLLALAGLGLLSRPRRAA